MAAAHFRMSCATGADQFSADADVERLIQLARGGHGAALDELIATWRTYLFHLADSELTADLRAKMGASDLVQNACLDIHQRFDDFQGNTAAEWRVWLRRMLIHDLQDARRRYLDTAKRDVRREQPLVSDSGSPIEILDYARSPRASMIAVEESAALREGLARLPLEYREVLRLRNWDCLPFAEIGRQMNRSEEAARKVWARAVLRLQHELEKNELL